MFVLFLGFASDFFRFIFVRDLLRFVPASDFLKLRFIIVSLELVNSLQNHFPEFWVLLAISINWVLLMSGPVADSSEETVIIAIHLDVVSALLKHLGKFAKQVKLLPLAEPVTYLSLDLLTTLRLGNLSVVLLEVGLQLLEGSGVVLLVRCGFHL